MGYERIELKESILIKEIISIHYFEYMSDFYFAGESHDFWEFVCVDKGEVDVLAGEVEKTLQKGSIIFHKPNEFHNVKANGKIAPNLVVIAFQCDSKAMNFFKDRVLTISEKERNLLAQIIIEAKNSFSSRLDDPYLQKLERSEVPTFGSEQLIKLYLEQMMIQLIRRYHHSTKNITMLPTKSMKQKNDSQIYTRVLAYLEENLHNHLSIEQICHDKLGRASCRERVYVLV